MSYLINYWIIPRNKRILTPVIDILSIFHLTALNQEWKGQTGRQLNFEEALEKAGIKRIGPRRDQRGSGARTYEAWLSCLGLIFIEESTGLQRLTLAGERLLAGDSPVAILTDQLMKFQYPSSYSIRRNVNLSSRFRVHPFRFLLSLLQDGDIGHLTQEEIALFVITKGESNSEKCVKHVAERIKNFRTYGKSILPHNFELFYPSRSGVQSFKQTVLRLNDVANTFINFLEYTQLCVRDENRKLQIIKPFEVMSILSNSPEFILYPENKEYFQRRFGLVRGKNKDTRSFGRSSVSAAEIQERIISREFLNMASQQLVSAEDKGLIYDLVEQTGGPIEVAEKVINEYKGREAGIFEAEYYRMSLAGKDQAKEFEIATKELFGENGFNFTAKHVGSKPKHPDVYVFSKEEGFSGIIDNKAYASYSINNDHYNRMVHNYIPTYKKIDKDKLKFFMYISGGFKNTFNNCINEMSGQTGIGGCGITSYNLIKLLEKYKKLRLSHQTLLCLFVINREILSSDISNI